jgi:phosphate transport system permease protein
VTIAQHAEGPGRLTVADLRPNARKRRAESVARWFFLSAAALSIVVTALIVLTIVSEAWSFISRVDTSALLDRGWFPRRGLFDIPTLVIGTMLVAGIAMLVATPLGLGVAIYLSEYANPRVRRVVKPIIEILAGIPSVVLGYFALYFITPELLEKLKSDIGFNLLAAGLAVGVLTLPLVATVAEDAMRAVPAALREGAYGLGARKITVSTRIVFPAAISGIVAAFIIGLSRAIGETMVVAIAAGATGGSLRHFDVLEPGQTMTAAMASLGFGSDQVAGDDLAFQSLYFIGLLLFVMTFLLNLVGDVLVRRVREAY